MDEEQDDRPSKSARKREHQELQQLVLELLEMPETRLARLALGERFREELQRARGMGPSGARNRQVRLLAQLALEEDRDALRAAPLEERQRHHAETARHHAAEQLRERLLEQGIGALAEVAASAEQRVRVESLLRDAAGLADGVRARSARRELYHVALQLLAG